MPQWLVDVNDDNIRVEISRGSNIARKNKYEVFESSAFIFAEDLLKVKVRQVFGAQGVEELVGWGPPGRS